MDPGDLLALLLVVVGGAFIVRPLVAAVSKRIAGEARRPEPDHVETEELRAELQQVRQELGELAERMDFAERLLAQRREADRLAPPGR